MESQVGPEAGSVDLEGDLVGPVEASVVQK